MNLKKLNEELNKVLNEISDGLADQAFKRRYRKLNTIDKDELEEVKSNNKVKKIFDNAVEGLEKLQEFIGAGTNPVDGRLDDETTEFYTKLTDMIEEIHSRSLAWE